MTHYKHVYDIDVIGILDTLINPGWRSNLLFRSESKRHQFTEMLKIAAEGVIDCDSKSLENLIATKTPKVLYPNANESIYQFWLAHFLSLQDPAKIPLILFYHWKNLKFEKWFLDHLEYKVLLALPSEEYIDISIHKKEIISWINLQRVNTDYIVEEELRVPSEKIDAIFNTLKTLVLDENRHTDFLNLLKGNKITQPIHISGTVIFFVAIFEKLSEAKIIVINKSNLSKWLHQNFTFRKTKSQQIEKASFHYLLRLLSTKYAFTKAENIFLDPIFNPVKIDF